MAAACALMVWTASGCSVTRLRLPLLFKCMAPSVDKFDATPQSICAGDSVQLAWHTKGDTTLDAAPPIADTGAVDTSGTRSFSPTQTTTFTITATRFGEKKFSEQEVTVVPQTDESQTVMGMTRCEGSDIVADVEMESDMSAQQRIRRVSFGDGITPRPVTIHHDDREAQLGPETLVTEVFRGQRPDGTWTIRSPIQQGERCGDPRHHPPTSLSITLTVGCSK